MSTGVIMGNEKSQDTDIYTRLNKVIMDTEDKLEKADPSTIKYSNLQKKLFECEDLRDRACSCNSLMSVNLNDYREDIQQYYTDWSMSDFDKETAIKSVKDAEREALRRADQAEKDIVLIEEEIKDFLEREEEQEVKKVSMQQIIENQIDR